MKTKATVITPNCIFLTVYQPAIADAPVALVGSWRRMDGTIEPNCYAATDSSLWPAMAAAMDVLSVINATHIVTYTNSATLLKWHNAPAPTSTQRVWEQKGKGKGNGQYADYPVGGDAFHWAVMRGMVAYWCRGGTYQVIPAPGAYLAKAQDLYNSTFPH